MPIIGSNILAGSSGVQSTGPDIGDYSGKSIVISSGVASTQCITRTPGVAGDTKKWTQSVWVKNLKPDASGHFSMSSYGANNGIAAFYFHGTRNDLETYFDYATPSDSSSYGSLNDRLFRDTSAWQHFIWAVDSANTVQKVWVNGVELACAAGQNPVAWTSSNMNNTQIHKIGIAAWGSTGSAELMIANFIHLDGQYITDPTKFGHYSDDTGVWCCDDLDTSLTMGTNGFWLKFDDDLTDSSSNSNTWTNVGSCVFSNDTPVNNFMTLRLGLDTAVLKDGNRIHAGTDEKSNVGGWGFNAGQWYWEIKNTSSAYGAYIGIISRGETTDGDYNAADSSLVGNATYNDYGGTSYTTLTGFLGKGVWGFELDSDAGRIYYYLDGLLQHVDNNIPTDGRFMYPVINTTNSGVGGWGNQEFNTGVPSYSGTDQADANGKGSFEENVLAHHDLISRSAGTAIGNMTSGGNLAASFDGALYKAYAACSQTASNPDDGGYIGKDWGVGQSKTVTRVMVHPGIEYGFVGGTADTTFSVTLRGSDSVPSDYKADGTQLATSGALTDSNTRVPYDTLSSGHSVTTSTAYRYHWIVVEPLTIDDDAFISQCEFFEESDKNYLAPCTANMPEIEIGQEEDDLAHDYFNTRLYTGTAASLPVTGVGFSPDLVWVKSRSTSDYQALFDTVRGATKYLRPSADAAETTTAESLKTFDSDGFTLGTNSTWNASSMSGVSWNWLGGASTLGTGDFTQGATASTCSRNVDAGFSVVSYTGSGSATTIGHGLSSAPDLIIVKKVGSVTDWITYHSGNTSAPETDYLILNLSDATADGLTSWNDTAPTSSVFTVGSRDATNSSSNAMIAYCWHSVEGFSHFGSYIGNGNADGTFVYTGFEPAFVMTKRSDSSDHWRTIDNKRHPINDGTNPGMKINTDETEADAGNRNIDFLSNGFKIRDTDVDTNADGGLYVYLAFSSGTGFKYGVAN
jgi:hypothetical protein